MALSSVQSMYVTSSVDYNGPRQKPTSKKSHSDEINHGNEQDDLRARLTYDGFSRANAVFFSRAAPNPAEKIFTDNSTRNGAKLRQLSECFCEISYGRSEITF